MSVLSKFFGPPSIDEFARLVSDAMRADGIAEPISMEPATRSLRIGSGTASRLVHLGNFYAEFVRVPRGERAEYIRGVVRRCGEMSGPSPKHPDEARQRLVPNLRSRCYFSFSNLSAEANGMEIEVRPFALLTESIGIGLVLDYPETMRVVDHALLATWEMDEAAALELAVRNLRARTEPQFAQHARGVWVSKWQDSYDATRLLLPELVTSLRVKGRHVALVPHRNVLIVTGDEDRSGLQMLAQLATTAFSEPQPISVTPLVRDGDAWTELRLADSHPAAAAFAHAQLQMRAQEYQEQKELLEAVAERRNDDSFIATFRAQRNESSGALSSFCSWSEGIVQKIPPVDRVGFVGEGANGPALIGFAEWGDVVRVMRDAMQPTNDYPPRYATSGFPNESELREMRVR
jgi:hypothetical protein